MIKSNNPYFIRTEETEGITRYFVIFKDGQAITQEIEITETLYQAFDGFRRDEKRQRSSFERHIEYSELTDESLHIRAFRKSESIDDTIIWREYAENYRRAVAELPEIQRRRFVLYYEHGLKLREIGELEGCGINAVQRSIVRAKEKIRKKLEV